MPGTAFRFEMVPVPASTDGSVKAFWIGRTELTWEAFDPFVYPPESEPGPADASTRPSKPYLPPDRGFGHAGFAAISMSFQTATEYCAWLSAATGRKYRLATEAEWEHACSLGGVTITDPGEAAWYAANSDGKPHAAGTKMADALGLYDMRGNVAEWVAGRDGRGVTKGGSYRDEAAALACGARAAANPAWNASDPQVPKSRWWLADGPFVGFRVVCERK